MSNALLEQTLGAQPMPTCVLYAVPASSVSPCDVAAAALTCGALSLSAPVVMLSAVEASFGDVLLRLLEDISSFSNSVGVKESTGVVLAVRQWQQSDGAHYRRLKSAVSFLLRCVAHVLFFCDNADAATTANVQALATLPEFKGKVTSFCVGDEEVGIAVAAPMSAASLHGIDVCRLQLILSLQHKEEQKYVTAAAAIELCQSEASRDSSPTVSHRQSDDSATATRHNRQYEASLVVRAAQSQSRHNVHNTAPAKIESEGNREPITTFRRGAPAAIVWWDVGNIQIPADIVDRHGRSVTCRRANVVRALRSAFARFLNIDSEVNVLIKFYCVVQDRNAQRMMASLVHEGSGSELLLVPCTPQAADDSIIESIVFTDMNNDPDVHFVVVSDDRDFCSIAHEIRTRRPMTIAVCERKPAYGEIRLGQICTPILAPMSQRLGQLYTDPVACEASDTELVPFAHWLLEGSEYHDERALAWIRCRNTPTHLAGSEGKSRVRSRCLFAHPANYWEAGGKMIRVVKLGSVTFPVPLDSILCTRARDEFMEMKRSGQLGVV